MGEAAIGTCCTWGVVPASIRYLMLHALWLFLLGVSSSRTRGGHEEGRGG